MSWSQYSPTQYAKDRAALTSLLGKKELTFCNCEEHQYQEKLSELKTPDLAKFVVNLFLESLLESVVHEYDPQNYYPYIKALGAKTHCEIHGPGNGTLPQFFLARIEALPALKKETLMKELTAGMRHLLPQWAKLYGTKFSQKISETLPSILADDKDLSVFTLGEFYPAFKKGLDF